MRYESIGGWHLRFSSNPLNPVKLSDAQKITLFGNIMSESSVINLCLLKIGGKKDLITTCIVIVLKND